MREVVVGVGAGGPLIVEVGVGLGGIGGAAERVGKFEGPSGRSGGAESFFVVEIVGFREGELPGFAVVFGDGMFFGVSLDEGHRAVGAGGDPAAVFEPSGG